MRPPEAGGQRLFGSIRRCRMNERLGAYTSSRERLGLRHEVKDFVSGSTRRRLAELRSSRNAVATFTRGRSSDKRRSTGPTLKLLLKRVTSLAADLRKRFSANAPCDRRTTRCLKASFSKETLLTAELHAEDESAFLAHRVPERRPISCLRESRSEATKLA